ncbi:hypothetical protein CEP52_017220 [Fusarium oligoseptatum]|uniref:Uncharacterized protein n=1 Tax=Fusarium oligoseptatum TaxID=2604345 RepID=A0A428RV32_9HYPO|nr:hypothetical protein CEP52_017220 [Fusarium oligoseptatum]
MVVRPAIVGRDIIPVGDPPELIDTPQSLKPFTFEDTPRLQKTAICGDSSIKVVQVRDCEPYCLPMTKESNPIFFFSFFLFWLTGRWGLKLLRNTSFLARRRSTPVTSQA